MAERVTCWEQTGCAACSCPVHGDREKQCWHETGTLCTGGENRDMEEKVAVCLSCEVFRSVLNGGSLTESGTYFLTRLKEQGGGGSAAEELSLGLSQTYLTLTKLCIGDGTVRVAAGPEGDLFHTMRLLLNRVAERMQGMVGQSHEMAIGLCQHYETLNRISQGDLTARAGEKSDNELIAKLGVLINAQTEALTGKIRELEKARESLHEQYHFLQVLSDTIPSPIFFKDASGRYLGCNDAYQNFVNLSREALIGKTVHELWPKELADRYRQMDQELMERAGVQVYEARVRSTDGKLRDVIFYKAAFRNQDGELGGLVGVILDITERKAAEEETKNAYRKIADILEFLPDATFVVDQEKRVIAWNRATEEMTGVQKEEILGQGDHAYALPFYGSRREILIDLLEKDPEFLKQNHIDVRRNGRTLLAVTRIPDFRGDGERIFRSVAAPLFNMQGERVGGIQTMRDITELKHAERERTKLEAQRHHSRMIESLMLQLGHDLKTPLTPLFALLPLIRKKVADPSLERMLDICQQSASQIQGLTAKALQLVRLSSDTTATELVSVQLHEAAESSREQSAPLFAERGITCRNSIDPALYAFGVPEQLTLLFDNLLSNAARYAADDGSVVISATADQEEITVSVQDDGIGLEPEHLLQIFDEFFKADAARHDLSTQGLGLAICKRIVLNHKGRIWAHSPGPHRGTAIHFTLQPSQGAST